MHIPVKPLKQDERDCTLTCIMMLLDFYGCRITRQEVESSIKTTEAGHIYMVEVARFLHTLGLKVDCLSYNLYYTDPQNANLSKDKFIKTLEKEQDIVTDDWFKERIKATIEAIKQGVNYSIQKPTIETMVSYLEQGIPILLAVS